MKTIFATTDGSVTLTEQAGQFTLTLKESQTVGGGKAAGILSAQGSGAVVLQGKVAFDLGMAILESHSPAALVPFEQGAQAMADATIASE